MAGQPPRPEDVRPITIGDNVWIGQYSIITPGVTIGEGSIVSGGSVVVNDVPPYVVVAGYPARKIASLRNPHAPDPSREVAGATL
jgi:acetyltransferase-like isoleucine patch superfamily enzyme